MDVASGIGMALLWAVVPGLVLLAVLWWIDKYEKEPVRFIAIALVGGVLAFAVTALVQAALGQPQTSPELFALEQDRNLVNPIVAEVAKAAAVLAMFFLVAHEFDDTLDGIMYGAAVGAGFAMAQHAVYFYTTYAQLAGFIDVPWTTYLQVVVSGLNHSFYAALFGAGLGYMKTSGEPGKAIWAPILGLLAAVLLHLMHDYLPAVLVSWAQTWPVGALPFLALVWNAANWLGMLILAVIVVWAWGRQTVVIQEQLDEEVALGVVQPEEYSILSSSLRREIQELETLFRRGFGAYQKQKRLYDLEVELAFKKWHARLGEAQIGRQRSMSVDEYRQQIRATRASLLAQGATA